MKTWSSLAEYVKQRDEAGLPVGAPLRRVARSTRGGRPLPLGGTRERIDLGKYPRTDIGYLMLKRDLALASFETEYARRKARRAGQAPR